MAVSPCDCAICSLGGKAAPGRLAPASCVLKASVSLLASSRPSFSLWIFSVLSISLLVVPAALCTPGWSHSDHLVPKQLQNPPLPRVSFHIIPLALPHLTFLLPTGRLAGSFTRQPCGLIDSLPLLTAGEVLDVPTGERINHRGLTRCFEVEGTTGGRAFPHSAASPIAWEGQKSTECVQPKGCLWQLLPAARLRARGCSEMELCCGTAGRRLPAFPVLLQQKAEWQRGGKKGVATSP